MNAIVDKGGQIILEDTHFHHLLTENLYMPRRGVSLNVYNLKFTYKQPSNKIILNSIHLYITSIL